MSKITHFPAKIPKKQAFFHYWYKLFNILPFVELLFILLASPERGGGISEGNDGRVSKKSI